MKKKTGAFQVYLRFIASVYRNNKLFVLSKVFISVLAGLLSVVTAVLPKYMADAILIDNSEYGFIAYVLLYVLAQLIIGAVYNFVEIYINKSLIVVKAKCTEEVLERLYRMVYAKLRTARKTQLHRRRSGLRRRPNARPRPPAPTACRNLGLCCDGSPPLQRRGAFVSTDVSAGRRRERETARPPISRTEMKNAVSAAFFCVAPPKWAAQTAGIRPPSARDSNLQNRPGCLTTGTET